MSFALAWRLLTILPLPGNHARDIPSSAFSFSLQWFPVVGFLLGASLLLLDRMLEMVFPPVMINAVLVAVYVLMTGGLHLDGWADTMDALAGGKDAEHRLAILRDSRIGGLGAAGLMLILGLRFAALLALPAGIRDGMLLCMPAIGRWAMLVGCWKVIYPRADGLAAPYIRTMTGGNLWVPSLLTGLGLWGAIGGWPAVAVMIGVGAAIRLAVRQLSKMFGGITGDMLGAMNEGSEVLVLTSAPFLLMLSGAAG